MKPQKKQASAWTLGNLPVWAGIQEEPGIRKILPFGFRSEQGVIRLGVGKKIRDSIIRNYDSEDYSFITTPPGYSEWGSYLGDLQFKHLSRMVGDLTNKTVLEIGSGSLYMAKRIVSELNAKRFIACDPVLKGEKGDGRIDIKPIYFSPEAFQKENIHLVISINSLEHMLDPFSYLKDVRRLLEKTKGDFFLMLPDCTRGFSLGDWGICLHEHLSYFTTASLLSTLARVGFQAKRLISEEDEIIALLSVSEAVSDSPIDTLNLEWVKERFQETKNYAKKLIDLLKAKKQGPVGVHGCSVAVNHLFYSLDLHQDPDIYLFDQDRVKVGKYMPSFHRPILQSKGPFYKKMASIIVGNTTYFNSIQNHAIQMGIPPTNIFPLIPSP